MVNREPMDEALHDLIEIMQFTGDVAAKIHGVSEEKEIYRVVKEQFSRSNRYTASILLFSNDASRLEVAETSISFEKNGEIPEIHGRTDPTDNISDEVNEGRGGGNGDGRKGAECEYEQENVFYSRPIAYLISKMVDYEKKPIILMPLTRKEKAIGVFAMSSTKLAEYFIPSVRALSQHISTALELAYENEKRKRTEVALRKERDRIQKYLDTAGVIFNVLDIKGKVKIINKKGCETLGYGESEIVGKNWVDEFIPERMRDKVRSVFGKLMSGDLEPVEYFENPILTKGGEERIIAWHNAVITDGKGGVAYALGSGEDVTERKAAEGALRDSQRLLRSTLDSLRDAVIIVDAETTVITDCNPAAEEIFGYVREDIIGKKTVFLHKSPSDLEQFRQHLYKDVEILGFLSQFESRMKRKNGTIFPTEHSVMPLTEETGKPIAWVSVIRDITERKRMEEEIHRYTEHLEEEVRQRTNEVVQSVKMAALGQLVAGVAHEVNNPLAFIKSNTQSINSKIMELTDHFKGTDLKLETLQHLERLMTTNEKGIDRIARITRTLKRFAKTETEGKSISDVNQGIRDTLFIVHNHMTQGIDLHAEYGDLPQINCNIGQLNQVFMNLMLNAFQSMDEGDIWIRTWKDDEDIFVEIKDNGSGIPAEQLDKIFDPFFSTKDTGTGLGLSISYRIIMDHNGEISVTSEVGKGTTFRIKLPLNL